MEPEDTNQNNEQMGNNDQTTAQEELSHSDKMIGVLTEPTSTFEKISKFPIKTIDWLLPVLIASLVAPIAFVLMMSNNQINSDYKTKLTPKIEKQIQQQIDRGKINKDQSETAKEIGLKWAIIITYPSKFLGPWFILFLTALIYWLIIKYGFKTDATYTGILVALGLPFYIIIIQYIVTSIIAYLTGQYLNAPNLAEIMGMEVNTVPGLLLSFVDIFMIWYFIVVSIGLIKINHAISATKYYVLTFGLWIVFMFVIFAIF